MQSTQEKLKTYLKEQHANHGGIPAAPKAAVDLGINRSSVQAAYRDLNLMGFIKTPWGPKQGYAPGWDWRAYAGDPNKAREEAEEIDRIALDHTTRPSVTDLEAEHQLAQMHHLDLTIESTTTHGLDSIPPAMAYRPPQRLNRPGYTPLWTGLKALLNASAVKPGEPMTRTVEGHDITAIVNFSGEDKGGTLVLPDGTVVQHPTLDACIDEAVSRL